MMSNNLTIPLTEKDRLLLEIKYGKDYLGKIADTRFNDVEPWETQAERRANREWLLQMVRPAKQDNAE
jgi:hypothetical protein